MSTGARPNGAAERRARVLVVDDEPGIREGCRRILSSRGYEVVTAEDGAAGLEQHADHGPFDVLLVDLMMPRMSGLELVGEIRKRDPDVVPIIITAHATIETAVEGTKQGAYSYIPKPFTPDELLLSMKNGLERRTLTVEARRLREERERRLLEVASERSRSRTIITAMTDGVLVINMDRLVVLRNAAAARILPECAALSLPFPLEVLSRGELAELVGVVIDSPGGFRILSRELTLGEATYQVNASPVIEPGGETSGAVAVFRDITALKRLETAKSMFVSMVAHEVKSPLAAAEGWLNLILSGTVKQDPEEERRIIQRALLRVKTLRGMVSELLNLTAIQTGNFTLRREPLDVEALVREAVEAHREKAEEKRIRLAMEAAPETVPEGAARVLGDRDALAIVYGNLIENAVKYTPDGGQVSVRVSREGIYVSAAVSDTGIGMSEEEQGKAFDEFYRARNEHTASIPGTGLGLALVKRLTELHQGRVALASEPGKGSRFTVSIPASGEG